MAKNKGIVNLDLPIDTISEILSRLPVKSLLRFKSVCKAWCDLIENPNFIDKHEKNKPSITSILVTSDHEMYLQDEGFYKLIDLSSLILADGVYVSILGICNGLVCVEFNAADNLDYVIGNPTTRAFRRIPPSNLSDMEYDLVFFGFSFFSNEFMVVKFIYRGSSTAGEVVVEAEVYTMTTETWVKIDVRQGRVNNIMRLRGYGPCDTLPVVQNGVFYWEAISSNDGRVLSFDVSNGVVDEVNFPIGLVNVGGHFWRIIVFEERLSLVIYTGERKFELWALNENRDSWTWKLRIDNILDFPLSFGGNITVVDYTGNSEVLIRDCFRDDSELRLYDLNSREMKNLPCVHAEGPHYYFYTESLRPV